MLIDSRELRSDFVLPCDVCIIGAGAAGISLALELARAKLDVALVESGGFVPDEATQALYEGENVGIDYSPLHHSRLRFFGGSTNHWQGRCRPLDAIDFETRPWVRDSGWPLSKSDLDPFYPGAQELCKLGPLDYDGATWSKKGGTQPIHFASQRVENIVFQFSSAPNFQVNYRDDILRSSNITTLIYSNVFDMETDDFAKRVTRVHARPLSGRPLSIEARYFVLATGGIENARLLLSANRIQKAGLGNQNDLVGRYFMDHTFFATGTIVPSNPLRSLAFYRHHEVEQTRIQGAFALSPTTIREHRLLNLMANPTSVAFELDQEAKRLIEDGTIGTVRELYEHLGEEGDFDEHVRRVLLDLDDDANKPVGPATLAASTKAIRLVIHSEQAPIPESRVTLGDDTDELGLRRVRVDWRLSAEDKASVRKSLEIIGQELSREGVGRIRLEFDTNFETWARPPWNQTPAGAFHHMGTTRMASDPKRGVVDQDGRVHGMANLFVAGSSVFPTCGHANPTLTIVALALRLAEHLKRLLP